MARVLGRTSTSSFTLPLEGQERTPPPALTLSPVAGCPAALRTNLVQPIAAVPVPRTGPPTQAIPIVLHQPGFRGPRPWPQRRHAALPEGRLWAQWSSTAAAPGKRGPWGCILRLSASLLAGVPLRAVRLPPVARAKAAVATSGHVNISVLPGMVCPCTAGGWRSAHRTQALTAGRCCSFVVGRRREVRLAP